MLYFIFPSKYSSMFLFYISVVFKILWTVFVYQILEFLNFYKGYNQNDSVVIEWTRE